MPDLVNKPPHYTDGGIECIDVMRLIFGCEAVKFFCLLNAFKYLWRCMRKHSSPVVDVKKAVWYLNKFIDLEGEVK